MVFLVKTYDIAIFASNSLKQRKLRAFLTVIGIVIGVASIVSLISIGQGVQAQVNSRLGGLGADMVTISLGRQRAAGGGGFGGFEGFGGQRTTSGKNLTEDDVRVVKTTPGVLYVNGIVSDRGKVVYSGENSDSTVQGVDTTSWRFMITTQLASGRYLMAGDINSVVIGNRLANGVFKNNISVGDQITIEEKIFKVVGILQSGGSGGGDSGVYIPKETARQIFGLDFRRVDSITAKVSDASNIANITSNIQERLRISRHLQLGKEDFTVSNTLAVQSQISSVTSTITLFLGAIAGISLLVGAIGISNTMFTSVMERTRQIGILKSLGATDSEVMKIFVTEASIIGLVGGVIGALLGLAVSQLISIIGSFNTLVTPELFISAMLFAVVVGAVSGYFPAKRAAALQPVDALRYE